MQPKTPETINLNSEDHDKYFSKTSHLPHLIAFTLISMISKSDQIQKDTFTGGGLKDFTRIASSDPKMWEDIFLSNQINILEALKRFKSELNELEKLIEEKDSNKINQFIKDIEHIFNTDRKYYAFDFTCFDNDNLTSMLQFMFFIIRSLMNISFKSF